MTRPPHAPAPGMRWAQTELGWIEQPAPKRKGKTPHAKLKEASRKLAHDWFVRNRFPAMLLKSFVGTVTTESGQEIYVGRKGETDDKFAVLGTVLAAEYKAGDDTLKSGQRTFRDKWLAIGLPHVVVRQPSDLIDALDQIAAQRARGPFG